MAKDKIAMFPFSGIRQDYNMTSTIENEMTSLLVNQKRFDVIERGELGRIIKEQQLQSTGLIEVSDAVSIGKIGGIKYAVLGSVPNVNYSSRQVFNESTGKNELEVDALVVFQVKIIDVQTAAITFSETFKMKPGGGLLGGIFGGGDASADPETMLASMVKRYFEKDIDKKMSNAFPVEGSILSMDKKSVVIDIGSESGVEEGMKLDVIFQEKKLNPKTQKEITIEKKVGVLKVTEVSGAESAVCKIKDGEDVIKEGMAVKLQKK
ncbi:MAG: CsgG/HfaB family protein [Elusimicrobiota bacterium]|nr:CsgG/HfaB family protein [Elusimicrobiota bacterium]